MGDIAQIGRTEVVLIPDVLFRDALRLHLVKHQRLQRRDRDRSLQGSARFLELQFRPRGQLCRLGAVDHLLVGVFHRRRVQGTGSEFRFRQGRHHIDRLAALLDDPMDADVLPQMLTQHVDGIEGQDGRTQGVDPLMRSRSGVGRLSLENERGPLHGQKPLVGAPGTGRVGDQDHIGALKMLALQQCRLAAAEGAAFLIGCADDNDASRSLLHQLGQARRCQKSRRRDEVVPAGMPVRQRVILQHDRDRWTRSLSVQLCAERGLGDPVFDQVVGDLEVARDLESELAEFIHQKLGTLELLLPPFLEIEDFLRHDPAVRRLIVDRSQQRFLVCRRSGHEQQRQHGRKQHSSQTAPHDAFHWSPPLLCVCLPSTAVDALPA
ncbi:MAG: hypothetical protein A4E73_00727 [Syntrophaceae bacterium PtaU1.Bin231]|nr:MAG: hypothetical protein A4E73_00727 [Syntrophaceae bacterium PtaU1.Bin231]